MDSEDATADRGRKMAMPALLDETKRMLEVLFVYALRVVAICYRIPGVLFESSSSSSPIHPRNPYLCGESKSSRRNGVL